MRDGIVNDELAPAVPSEFSGPPRWAIGGRLGIVELGRFPEASLGEHSTPSHGHDVCLHVSGLDKI